MPSIKSSLLALAAVLTGASAHYNFESLVVNGQATRPYEYVRRTTNSNSPIENVQSQHMVCNQGGLDANIRAATSTYTVQAGDELGFLVNVDLGHPGPLAVYLSRAPNGVSAQNYLGDGEWSKIYALTSREIRENYGIDWASFPNNVGIRNFTFTLPPQTPPGEYLVRAEHLAIHGAGSFGGAQFYIGCAQIRVENRNYDGSVPGPTVRFPGAYTGNEPGILVNIYWPPLTSYQAPGPVTWPNRCEDHTANFVGQQSDGDCTPLGS
ncbi:cellulose-growth-specific protein [Sodiomyces alkalinus F11]|uniref:lytic cellulose monooxygenase (C4-dehydrogenating) n=1 Tax=Sodiomyces alkalinus (strain CBS 110278 / VKM F-3762 / F11) TaxID=1314773 RepID=A0A3N2PSK4_SODAK|nr:cellulose-growth-specific protein [Sodiomyces alkalinus F11]ROT37404.1 cellulose-growth-specific protein [Sodiomyces alkalinus F11]